MIIQDSAGNIATTDNDFTITLDTTIYHSGRLRSQSDTGVANDDNITSNKTLEFSGAGIVEGDSVVLMAAGSLIGTEIIGAGQTE